jgi:hypothetical protein
VKVERHYSVSRRTIPQPAATFDSPTVYFPAQYVNQATEIEPMPPTF